MSYPEVWQQEEYPQEDYTQQYPPEERRFHFPKKTAAILVLATVFAGQRSDMIDFRSPYDDGIQSPIAEGQNWGDFDAAERALFGRPAPQSDAVQTPKLKTESKVEPGSVQRHAVDIGRVACFKDVGTIDPSAITVHFTQDLAKGTPRQLCNFMKKRGVSVQYYVDYKGKAWQLTQDVNSEAWHSKGENDYSLGIENGARNQSDLLRHPKQYDTTVNLVLDLVEKYSIPIPFNNPGCYKKEVLNPTIGVHGHYELSCSKADRTDPGKTYMQYLRQDIARLEKANTDLTE